MADVRYQDIDEALAGQRLDNFLIKILKGVPKSRIYRMIRGGEVRVNKKRADVSTRLEIGDSVRIPPVRCAEKSPVALLGDRLSAVLSKAILYEDDALLVVNKPLGIAVHGGSGLSLGLIEAFRQMRQDLSYLELVHRLDKETSGCLLLAKKRSALRAIQALLTSRQVTKIYWAICHQPWEGTKRRKVTAALQKHTHPSGERFVVVNETGKPSHTDISLLEQYDEACWVQATPKTGRTHQIRVHCASIGHPIVGDQKYGKDDVLSCKLPSRLYLHARAIAFELDGKRHAYEAPIDEAFEQALAILKKTS